jgi:hypothetical protein
MDVCEYGRKRDQDEQLTMWLMPHLLVTDGVAFLVHEDCRYGEAAHQGDR